MSYPMNNMLNNPYEDKVKDAKFMLEELKKAQANFIIKNKKYQEDLTALEVGELDELGGGNDETLDRIYNYLENEYKVLVEKKKAISYITKTLRKMNKPVPNNLEGKPLKEILALQTEVMNDYDAYLIMADYRNRKENISNVSVVGQKVKKSKKKSKRNKKSKRKNKRKPSKKK